MFDKEQVKSLQDGLIEPVAERIQNHFKKKYWLPVGGFVLALGWFGYDTYWDIESYKTQLEDLSDQLTETTKQQEDLSERLGEMIGRLSEAESALDEASRIAEDVKRAQQDIIDVDAKISDLHNRNFGFVVKSAADIYLVAESEANAVDFYKDAQKYADDIGDKNLLIFATLSLAQAYSEIEATSAARREFGRAEAIARERYESPLLRPEQRKLAFNDYLDVLLSRAEDESNKGSHVVALLTLKNKALRLAMGDGNAGDISRIYAQMANVHSTARNDMESLELARTYYIDAIEAYSETTYNDQISTIVARLFNRLGVNSIAQYDLSDNPAHAREAVDALRQAREYASSADDQMQVYNSNASLAEVLYRLGELEAATQSICTAANLGRFVQREPQDVVAAFANAIKEDRDIFNYEALCK